MGLTRRLLAVGGQQYVRLASMDLNRLIQDLDESFRRLLGSQIVLEHVQAADLPCVLADRQLVEQILVNLVQNACEAMPTGGHLTVTTRASLNALFGKMDLGGGPRNTVEVQVADEGGGIPAEIRGKIFDPFFTTKASGLGLGLALCHRILEEHRGAIQVDSAVGRGTAVTCFLPIAK